MIQQKVNQLLGIAAGISLAKQKTVSTQQANQKAANTIKQKQESKQVHQNFMNQQTSLGGTLNDLNLTQEQIQKVKEQL